MFDNSALPSQRAVRELTANQLKDSLTSLTYRVGEIQSLLSKKMDRSQCLTIIEKKASVGQLRRSIDELQSKMRQQRKQEAQRGQKMQEISIQKINQLGKKLKTLNTKKQQRLQSKGKPQSKTFPKKDSLRRILPQQLYIESNQTMFSLLIEEISKLQQKDEDFERQLQARNKKVITLNNQVCAKIEKLQAQIDQKIKSTNSIGNQRIMGNTWSMLQRTNKATVHKSNNQNNHFESLRLDMLTKNIQDLQRQLLGKLNLKDVLPIIKQNHQPLSDSVQQLREYVEQSLESTRRILSSQTQINKQISLGVKLAWWHSYQQEHQIAIINKEIINLVPEIIQIGKGHRPNFVRILQQGLFILKILPIQSGNLPLDESNEQQCNFEQFQVMIGTEVHLLSRQSILRLQKNNEIRIIQRWDKQIVLSLQKL